MARNKSPRPSAPRVGPTDGSDRVATSRPLILDATVHLPGVDEKGRHQPTVVEGGQFLDELTDLLTDEQIDELTDKKILREATDAELVKAKRPVPAAAE